jgi:hypothetical protein
MELKIQIMEVGIVGTMKSMDLMLGLIVLKNVQENNRAPLI